MSASRVTKSAFKFVIICSTFINVTHTQSIWISNESLVMVSVKWLQTSPHQNMEKTVRSWLFCKKKKKNHWDWFFYSFEIKVSVIALTDLVCRMMSFCWFCFYLFILRLVSWCSWRKVRILLVDKCTIILTLTSATFHSWAPLQPCITTASSDKNQRKVLAFCPRPKQTPV